MARDLLYLPEVVKLNLGARLFFTQIAMRCVSGQPLAGVLQVKVTDPSSAAIPGALLTITGSSGEVRTITAEITGEARASLPAGTYALRIASPSFVPYQRQRIVISAIRSGFRKWHFLRRTTRFRASILAVKA